MLDQFGGGRKPLPGLDGDVGRVRIIALRPGGQQPAEVEQGIADGGQLPVDDGGQLGAVIAEQHVGQMEVAVDDPGLEGRRAVGLQPGGHGVDAGDFSRAGPAGELGIGGQLRLPALHLAFEIVVRPAQSFETDGAVVQRAQLRDALDHGQAHAMANSLRSGMQGRQAGGRVEAVDRLHQVEGRAENRLVATGRDQRRVGHITIGDGRQHPRLAAHGLVGIGPQMRRRTTQDIAATRPRKPQQDVLRSTGQPDGVLDGAGAQPDAVHPAGQRRQVHSLIHPDHALGLRLYSAG